MRFKDFILYEGAYNNLRGCRYWGDAGSGVLPLCRTTGRFMANHRGAMVNEGGTWGIFGGGIFLRQYQGIECTDQLEQTKIPEEHAKEELREESGYKGPIEMHLVYTYRDNSMGPRGLPCAFYYWNYVGIVPQEFGVNPEADSAWEEGGQSGWKTFEELEAVEPKHFGLKFLLENAGPKIKSLGEAVCRRKVG